jgi:hypothetical protein
MPIKCNLRRSLPENIHISCWILSYVCVCVCIYIYIYDVSEVGSISVLRRLVVTVLTDLLLLFTQHSFFREKYSRRNFQKVPGMMR